MASAADKMQLLGYCGLYCGNCGSYKRGRCKGCQMGGGFSSCQVRKCCLEKSYKTCAECDEYPLSVKSGITFSARYLASSSALRKGNLKAIREMGVEKWVEGMAGSGKR